MNTCRHEHYHRPERRLDGVVLAKLAHALPLLFAAGQRPEKGADWLAEMIWKVGVDPLEHVRWCIRILRRRACRGNHSELPWFTFAERIVDQCCWAILLLFKGVLVEVEDDVEGDDRFIVEIAHNFALLVRVLIVDELAQRFQAPHDVLPTVQIQQTWWQSHPRSVIHYTINMLSNNINQIVL